MKRFLSLILALALIFACAPVELVKASADDIILPIDPPIENPFATMYYSYEIVDFEARITSCDTWISGDVTIPSTLGGYPVTSIGDSAFYNCSSLTSIEIPDSVTSIGNWAFYNCSRLTSIVIPDSVTSIGSFAFESCISLTSVVIGDSVTSIGNYAFENCSSLTSIEIPDSVTSIGDGAFYECSSLTGIWVDANNANYCSDDYGVLFNKDKTTLIQVPGAISSYTIPDSVTSIGSSAFYYCNSLTSVTIGDSVTSIGYGAFSYSSLTSVTIGDSVTSIGDYAFWCCSSLTSIEIPDSVTSIGSSAFENCSSLTSVTIGDSVTSIGYGAFYYCSSLTSIEIPDSVTSIGHYAFENCSSLTSIEIPDSVTSIGDWAFSDCSSLTDVYYDGTEEQWNAITIGASNECLTNATIHFAEEAPTEPAPTEPEETVPTEPDVPVVDDNAPQIVIKSKTVTKDKEFTVTAEINNPGFCYLEVTPVIPSQFTLVKVENGELISDFTKGKQYVWVADEDVTDDGLLLTFTFLVDDSVDAGDYPVSFQVRTCGNYNEEPIELAVVAANIKVIDFIYGDATGDGKVDGFDVIRLKKYLANYDYETETSTFEIFPGADATGDGKVDGFDVIRLKKYLANYDYETGESTVVLGPQ